MKQRVLITGGAKGIGEAIVRAFHEAGYAVVFVDCDLDKGRLLEKELGIVFKQVDVSDRQQVEDFFNQTDEAKQPFTVLVNNVGITQAEPFLDLTYEAFDHVLKTNLYSAILFTQHVVKRMDKGGRIINIASTRALMSEAGNESYAASKGALLSLTHALAMSLQPYHITVNAISPGWIETGDYHALSDEDHLQHPANRVGKPEDIARACLFLADKDQDFINGENVVIDGGMTKKMMYLED
ncbi:oxidoreductase [Halolactibacillus alkaliphilus]|uniref:Oxidoreductase n=1 Tax=Halolactibacillus alkaliphilus TaxID=442899 RepID=A0A511X1I7_9BACI|nr:SDR family oxidoreductase [Halolactibacillus alkaliphilus]GEN56780.1 oxidoreductase [Halolactibacillus alkaliphilus]GGN71218.1 oxidoreductase [Halolactibacillus alkaliphilus]SFO81400.1 hypothetical protein SAMN05720591_11361 [Halolactibacillus alkaliphilus]